MTTAWDSESLLDKLVEALALPATRSAPTDPQLYSLLTNAQLRMIQVLAAQVPQSQYGAPEKMVTLDGGYTYTFAFYPLGHAEIRESREGAPLYPAPDWTNDAGGYVMEGQTIRWPGGRSRTFSDGPYARYVKVPTELSDTVQPILEPPHGRLAIVYDAAVEWATQGGAANADPYKDLKKTFLWGDGEGTVGLIPALKTQYDRQGGRQRADPRWYVGQGWR